MFQRPEDRMTAMAAAERLRAKAVADHRRQSAATSRLVVAFCARAVLLITFVFLPFLHTGVIQMSSVFPLSLIS